MPNFRIIRFKRFNDFDAFQGKYGINRQHKLFEQGKFYQFSNSCNFSKQIIEIWKNYTNENLLKQNYKMLYDK